MNSNFEEKINKHIKSLESLFASKAHEFSTVNRDLIPTTSGIYAIYENNKLVYIGISANLKRRILGDHLRGDCQASAFRKNLSKALDLNDEGNITDYIIKKCSFCFLEHENPKYLEHFAIGVLEPKLNR